MCFAILDFSDFIDLVGGPEGWRCGRGPAGCLTGFILLIYFDYILFNVLYILHFFALVGGGL